MYEVMINEWVVIILSAATSFAGVAYGLIKRIELKEALDLMETIKEVTHTSSEGGEAITVDEKIRIADEVIEILKR